MPIRQDYIDIPFTQTNVGTAIPINTLGFEGYSYAEVRYLSIIFENTPSAGLTVAIQHNGSLVANEWITPSITASANYSPVHDGIQSGGGALGHASQFANVVVYKIHSRILIQGGGGTFNGLVRLFLVYREMD